MITYEWNKDAQKKSGTTTLEVTNVQQDTSYTCKIRIDENWEEKSISVDMFGKSSELTDTDRKTYR